MKKPIKFQSKLERISDELEYYALSVPEKITKSLGTTKAVSVSARVNGSTPFLVSLHPVGGGRHKIRIKASVRKETGIEEGDKVRVQIIVIDREKVEIPKDLEKALKEEGVLDIFKSITPGKRNYIIRVIDQAAKPETRAKRIQEAVNDCLK